MGISLGGMMKVLKGVSFKLVLGILVLGFSVSCSDDDDSNKTTDVATVVTGDASDGDDASDTNGSDAGNTDVATVDVTSDDDVSVTDDSDVDVATVDVGDTTSDEPASWGDLPHNVKAYISSQTCSGGQVVKSNLAVDFSDARLAPGLDADQFADYPTVYCNDQNTITSSCRNFRPEGALYSGNVVTPFNEARNIHLPSVGLLGLTKENLEITLLPRAKVRDENGDLTEVPLVDGDIFVSVPNTTCGENVGEVQCDTNPCVDTPESHQCTFSYNRCDVASVSCSDGYTNTTASETGEQFIQLYCTKS